MLAPDWPCSAWWVCCKKLSTWAHFVCSVDVIELEQQTKQQTLSNANAAPASPDEPGDS